MNVKTTSLPEQEISPREPLPRVGWKGRQGKRHGIAYLFVAPATLLFLIFIVYGIAYNLYNIDV